MIPFKAKLTVITRLFARLLVSIAVGIAFSLLTRHAAQYFDFDIHTYLPVGVGAVTATMAWFAFRRVFAFTADCLDVPSVNPAFQTDATVRARAAAPPIPTSGQKPCSQCAVLETLPQEDGSLKVVITTQGLTKREFNTLRSRLGQVRAVSWSNPCNLGDGRRRLKGVLPPGPTRPEVLRKLEELTGNRV